MKYFILLVLYTFSISAKERVVVLDFVHPKNVSREMAVSSYNYFVSELNRTEQFDIIEKSQLKAVLKEIEFQQSGCTDTVCEIKIGQMLYADKIASGNIIKKGKKYIVTINIRNVKDNSLEFAETIDLYDVNKLEVSMNSITQKITRSESPTPLIANKESIYEMEPFSLHPGEGLMKWLFQKEENQIDGKNFNYETVRNKSSKQVVMSKEDYEIKEIIFPREGVFHLNENIAGPLYTFLLTLAAHNMFFVVPSNNRVIQSNTERDISRNISVYYYSNLESNPAANHPLLLSYFLDKGFSIRKEIQNDNLMRQARSLIPMFGVLLFAILDIGSKDPSIFSISFESDFSSFLPTSSPSQKRDYFEFSYSMRF